MCMLASPWRALFSDNAATWTSDFWAEPNELVTCQTVLQELNQTDGASSYLQGECAHARLLP